MSTSISPYSSSPAVAKQSAMMSFTHEQLTACANALWNLYAVVDGNLTLPDIHEAAARDRALVEQVHSSMVNCCLSLDAMAKAGG